MLEEKSADERCRIAARLASMFDPDHPAADARAAQELARHLVEDTVLAVREALSQSLKHSRFLPKRLAKRIAHDVESVAVPFLEVTEVFSDEELQALAITIREAGRTAMARRRHVSGPLAQCLAEVGGADTARALVGNDGAEVPEGGLRLIYERFQGDGAVLEGLADRAGVPLDLVENLIGRVSRAASRKLAARYEMPDFTEPVVAEARSRTLMAAIAEASEDSLVAFAHRLGRREELCPQFILRALRAGHLSFFEAAMAVRAGIPVENARTLVRRGGAVATAKLSQQAGIPACLRESYREAVEMAVAMQELGVASTEPERRV